MIGAVFSQRSCSPRSLSVHHCQLPRVAPLFSSGRLLGRHILMYTEKPGERKGHTWLYFSSLAVPCSSSKMVSLRVSCVSSEWGAFIQWPIESGRRKVTGLVTSQVSSSDNVKLFSHSQGNRRPPVLPWSWWMLCSTAETCVVTLFWVRKSVSTGSHNTFNLENYLSNPEHRLCFGFTTRKPNPRLMGFCISFHGSL